MAEEKKPADATEEVLAEAADILDPVGLQEEAEMPARILEEFVKNSRKKDKLLCGQLQVANFLQNYVAHEDAAQSPDTLDSEDTSRRKATEAKVEWKELKVLYQDHVESIKCAMIQALPMVEETQQKYVELQEAFQQLLAKKQVLTEKLQTAQRQWEHQQKRLRSLAELAGVARECKVKAQENLEQSSQELDTLKQQEEEEQEKLERNQNYLQLLQALQNHLVISEAKPEDSAQENKMVISEAKPEDSALENKLVTSEAKPKDGDTTGLALPPKSL